MCVRAELKNHRGPIIPPGGGGPGARETIRAGPAEAGRRGPGQAAPDRAAGLPPGPLRPGPPGATQNAEPENEQSVARLGTLIRGFTPALV